MGDKGSPASIRPSVFTDMYNFLQGIESPVTDSKKESLPSSNEASENKNRVVLAVKDQLPVHLLNLLEDWHKVHKETPPCATHSKIPISGEEVRVMKYLSQDLKELPALEEIEIVKPVAYKVYYFPIIDGNETGILTKFVSFGQNLHFLKKWLGGYRFQAEPVATRLTCRNGSFPDYPSKDIWEKATMRRLPSEFKENGVENGLPSAIPSKRRRESSVEDAESDLTSLSSSGSDIPPEITPWASTHEGRHSTSEHSVSRQRSASRHAALGQSESQEEDEEEDEDEAVPVGLSNRGLPVISRSQSTKGLVHGSANADAQRKLDRSRPARKSLNTLNARLPSYPPVNTSVTASDSGIDMPASSHSAPATIIKFKFMVPRTKMARDLRAENNEDNSEYLFNQAREFFRRYDRLVGTSVLECVVEGEAECRCIYNAKELSYYIEELRERRRIVKVIVTQSS